MTPSPVSSAVLRPAGGQPRASAVAGVSLQGHVTVSQRLASAERERPGMQLRWPLADNNLHKNGNGQIFSSLTFEHSR